MKTATDETVTLLWTPGRSRRQDAARAQRAADAKRALKEQKRQAKAQRKEQKRLEREQQAARERMTKRLRVWGWHTLIDAVLLTGIFVLILAAVVFFILSVSLALKCLESWCLAAFAGAAVCAIARCFTMNPDGDAYPFPPSPEVLDLAMTLPQDAKSALERVLDSSGRERWLVSRARREQRRRALLVRSLHVLGDSAAPIVDDAIRQGLDPLPIILEATLDAH